MTKHQDPYEQVVLGCLGCVTVPSFGEHCAHSARHGRPVFGCAAAKLGGSRGKNIWICNIWHIHLSYTRCVDYTYTQS